MTLELLKLRRALRLYMKGKKQLNIIQKSIHMKKQQYKQILQQKQLIQSNILNHEAIKDYLLSNNLLKQCPDMTYTEDSSYYYIYEKQDDDLECDIRPTFMNDLDDVYNHIFYLDDATLEHEQAEDDLRASLEELCKIELELTTLRNIIYRLEYFVRGDKHRKIQDVSLYLLNTSEQNDLQKRKQMHLDQQVE